MGDEELRDGLDDDIDRMARQRLEIEEQMREREKELAKIGDFDQAHCIEFEKYDRGWGDEVKFVFQCPDGTTRSESFRIEGELAPLKEFLDTHGADSVTDMVGAKHACIYTDNGWRLHRDAFADPRLYWSVVDGEGHLANLHLPSAAAVGVCCVAAVVCAVMADTLFGRMAALMVVSIVGASVSLLFMARLSDIYD